MSVYQEAYHLPEFTYDYEKLKIEQRGPVYICSFNDADNLNAMSYAQMAASFQLFNGNYINKKTVAFPQSKFLKHMWKI